MEDKITKIKYLKKLLKILEELHGGIDELYFELNNFVASLQIDITVEGIRELKTPFDHDTFIYFINILKKHNKYTNYLNGHVSHTLLMLLRDFRSYMFITIKALSMEHTFPGIAVSRKPFEDTLFYIEWLLVEPIELIEKILFNEVDDYKHKGNNVDFNKLKNIQMSKLINLHILKGHWIENIKQVYEIRYNKKSLSGLQSLWQSANHIITDRGSAPTKPGSLNYIFTNLDNEIKFYEYFLKKTIYLYGYLTEILSLHFKYNIKLNSRGIDKIFQKQSITLASYKDLMESVVEEIYNTRNYLKRWEP